MITYHSKPGTKVGDIVEIKKGDNVYKAKVIKTGYYNYEYGTIGWANGDKYFEATVEYELDVKGFPLHIIHQEPLLNNL